MFVKTGEAYVDMTSAYYRDAHRYAMHCKGGANRSNEASSWT